MVDSGSLLLGDDAQQLYIPLTIIKRNLYFLIILEISENYAVLDWGGFTIYNCLVL